MAKVFKRNFRIHEFIKFTGKKCQLLNSPVSWLQHDLIINSWPHCVKGGKEFRALGIKEGGERVADVTRIIT